MTRQQVIAYCIKIGVNTKDMCGDICQAVKQEADDAGVGLTDAEFNYIMISIDKAWSQFQDDAGVDPAKRLNNYDHAQIEKDLTPAW